MLEHVREFVLHVEKTLVIRRLYAPHMAPFQEAAQRLHEKCQAALGESGFTLRVGPTDLFLDRTSVVRREKREECFFFPLYRDGLRELTFAPGVAPEELDGLMTTLEAEEKRLLGPSDDTVSFLWRRDLANISYAAIDGIGDQEGDDEVGGKDEYRALVADLNEKIRNPAPAEGGQSYAFMLDADVKVAAADLHYEATTAHRAFEENPAVYRLGADEVAALRAETGEQREGELLGRFVEILLSILADPSKSVPAASLSPVFARLLDGYWTAQEIEPMVDLLSRLAAAGQSAPHPETRTAAQAIVSTFLTAERLRGTFEQVKQGQLPLSRAARVWDYAGDEVWELLIDFWSRLPEGDLRRAVAGLLRGRLAFHPDLLRRALASADSLRVRAGLVLLDERMERLYAAELLALAAHADENVRLKGLAAAARLGGPAALEAVWKAMEGDPAKPVRLLAFRIMEGARLPGLAQRLVNLVIDKGFSARPAWEREKYARLLGKIADESVQPLFESWIPAKKWLWQPHDSEMAEVAFHGLAANGPRGLEKVRQAAAAGGKAGEAAQHVLDALARETRSGERSERA